MELNRCVPLRDSYEVFSKLKASRLAVNGEFGYRVVNDPSLYNGFLSDDECILWTGGAATKRSEWLIFLANELRPSGPKAPERFGWFGITSFRPEGMNEKDVVVWREELVELLETFFGFHFR
jgi:hypothetical protein